MNKVLTARVIKEFIRKILKSEEKAIGFLYIVTKKQFFNMLKFVALYKNIFFTWNTIDFFKLIAKIVLALKAIEC